MKLPFVTLAAVIGAALSLHANLILSEESNQISVSVNDAAPGSNVVVANTVTGTFAAATWKAFNNAVAADWQDWGQSFQAPGNLDWQGFALEMFDAGNQAPGSAFTIKVYESSLGGGNAGTVVSTQFGTLPSGTWNTTAAGKFLQFDFGTPIAMTEGLYYTAMLHFDARGTGNATAGGDRVIRFKGTGGATEEGWAGEDARIFRHNSPFSGGPVVAYGTTPEYSLNLHVIAIPEPSTVALAMGGLGFGLVLLRRRLRRS